MNKLRQNLMAALEEAAVRLHELGLPKEIAERMRRLSEQVDQRCVVAVVGQVKAGKSSLINALLGVDLALVGATETTATINYFKYGHPRDPSHPIRCYWRGGQQTDVDQAFLNSLQGYELAALQRAVAIERLEYLLPSPFLEHITLVDTPGTGAVVEEHQNRTDAFMRLYRQLRERHDKEMLQIGDHADAVIYLVGHVPRSADQDWLEEFQRATQGRARALNAIGVMAKIDRDSEMIRRRDELADKIAAQIKHSLNTVVPVSAGIERALQQLLSDDQAGLTQLVAMLRTIPPSQLEKLLSDVSLYRELEDPDCPVTIAERETLLGNLPWTVFTTIARAAVACSFDQRSITIYLRRVAGFEQFRTILEQHFLQRSQFLRCYRIVNEARQLLHEITYQHAPYLLKEAREEMNQLATFLNFIRNANGDPKIADALEALVRERYERRKDPLPVTAVLEELGRAFDRIFHEFKEYNADFEALQRLEECSSLFSQSEQHELRPLLGLYGLELENRLPMDCLGTSYVEDRQRVWRRIGIVDRQRQRRMVAERAVVRYGLILSHLLNDRTA